LVGAHCGRLPAENMLQARHAASPFCVYAILVAALSCGLASAPGLVAGAGELQSLPLPSVPWRPGPRRYAVQVPGEARRTLSLYPSGGVVQVATGDMLHASLIDPEDGFKNWYLLELYDHQCPHCWYAVPIVTAVAEAFADHEEWRMASVNCHETENKMVCYFLELISGGRDYPTLLLCPPRLTSALPDEEAINLLSEDAKNLLAHMTGYSKKTFLDLLRCKKRFVSSDEEALLSAEELASWVSNETGLTLTRPERLHWGADFKDSVVKSPLSPPGEPGWMHDDRAGEPGVPAWSPEQRSEDALVGFAATISQRYRASQHRDIMDITRFLSSTFPTRGKAFAALAEMLEQAGPIHDPARLENILLAWTHEARIIGWESENYNTCQQSGAPNNCAMWTLLHVTLAAVAARGLTGSALRGDQQLAMKAVGQNRLAEIDEAVDFVKKYVSAFQACGPCRVQFLSAFEKCGYGRCEISDFRGLPLWLWRVHNAVSLRASLRHNLTVDRRWPMYEDCPRCWRQSLTMGGHWSQASELGQDSMSMDELDAPFHIDLVFWHIIRTYLGLKRMPKLQQSEHASNELNDMAGGSAEEPHSNWMGPHTTTRTQQLNASSAQAGAEANAAILEANKDLVAEPRAAHHQQEEGHTMQDLHKFLASAMVYALASTSAFVLALYLCLHGCDPMAAAHHAWCSLGLAAERGSRAPLINAPQPQPQGGGPEEEDKVLAADGEDSTSVRVTDTRANTANVNEGPQHSSSAIGEEDIDAE